MPFPTFVEIRMLQNVGLESRLTTGTHVRIYLWKDSLVPETAVMEAHVFAVYPGRQFAGFEPSVVAVCYPQPSLTWQGYTKLDLDTAERWGEAFQVASWIADHPLQNVQDLVRKAQRYPHEYEIRYFGGLDAGRVQKLLWPTE